MVSGSRSKCFVPGCRTGYKSERDKNRVQGKKNLSLFSPQEKYLEIWGNIIPRADRELSVKDSVCELHFEESDIDRYFEVKLIDGTLFKYLRGRPKLKHGAVPKFFPKLPKYLYKKSPVKMKHPKHRKVFRRPILKKIIRELPELCSENSDEPQNVTNMSQVEEFSFPDLVKNAHNIVKPNALWGVTCHPNFVMCAMWTDTYVVERRVVIASDLSIKVFLKEVDPHITIKKPLSVADISSILKIVNNYTICGGLVAKVGMENSSSDKVCACKEIKNEVLHNNNSSNSAPSIKLKSCIEKHSDEDGAPASKKLSLMSEKNDKISNKFNTFKKEGKILTLVPLEDHIAIKFNSQFHDICNPDCIKDNDISKHKGMNVLGLPMYMGFERHICKMDYYGAQLVVCYRAPCGKTLRSIQEVYIYLQKTKSSLKIHYFSFNPEVFPFRHFTVPVEECLHFVDDITNGAERYPISCVNMLTKDQPPFLEYATQLIPHEDVPLKQSEEFLCRCNCTDNCSDSLSCQCQQLTSQAYGNDSKVGYECKRLNQNIVTGIYECNSQCSCSKEGCLNRVVQNGLEVRLQLFKTEKKGWGLRCIDDLDKGTFLCSYVGEIYSDQVAEKSGAILGDEYLAELDYIEVAQKAKEGYEANVESVIDEISHDEEDENIDAVDNSDDKMSRLSSNASLESWSDYNSEDSYACDIDDNTHFTTNSNSPLPDSEDEDTSSKFKIREYFGDSDCFVINAKKKGNIARYFNHSCSPNVFVQNVFIESHDLRFPTVAFFTSDHVKAGTELSWDYNYKVNSVENKVLLCHCGSKNCRGRLL